MISLDECKKILNSSKEKKYSKEEIIEIRKILYDFANIVSIANNNTKNEKSSK